MSLLQRLSLVSYSRAPRCGRRDRFQRPVRADFGLPDGVRPHGARVKGEQPVGIHAQNRAEQEVKPRKVVAQAMRRRQDLQAHQQPGEEFTRS